MYANGYTNPNTILADLISSLCFNKFEPEHKWNLVYPTGDSEEEIRDSIILRRRATISTSFTDDKEWIYNEKHTITQENFDEDPDFIIVQLERLLSKDGQVRIRNSRGTYLYRTSLDNPDSMDDMEFYVDELNNTVKIYKGVMQYIENMYYVINYEAVGTKSETWYVAFDYPYFDEVPDEEQNRYFFCWQFGKNLTDDFFIGKDKGFSCPYITTYWHNSNLSKYPVGDWLPIEYFIYADERSISFMFCEDPVYAEEIIHGFGYIGALDSIPGALKSDNTTNFGSGGNYLANGRIDYINLGGSGQPYDDVINPNTIEVFVELYDETHENLIESYSLFKLNDASIEVDESEYDYLMNINMDGLLTELGLETEYKVRGILREGLTWFCSFDKRTDAPVNIPEIYDYKIITKSIDTLGHLNWLDALDNENGQIKNSSEGITEVPSGLDIPPYTKSYGNDVNNGIFFDGDIVFDPFGVDKTYTITTVIVGKPNDKEKFYLGAGLEGIIMYNNDIVISLYDGDNNLLDTITIKPDNVSTTGGVYDTIVEITDRTIYYTFEYDDIEMKYIWTRTYA